MKLEKCIQNGIRPIELFNYLKELSKKHPGSLRIFIKGVEWKRVLMQGSGCMS
jgi:hypothetical protein